jgi:hypothetical protein
MEGKGEAESMEGMGREVKKRKIDRGTLDELLAIGKLVDAMKAV